MSVFSNKSRFDEFRWKNADVSTTKVLCQVNHISFGSS